MIEFKRIDHLQICVPLDGEEIARKFYVDLLQLSEIEKPEYLKSNGGFWLKIAGIELHIGLEPVTGKSKRHPAFVISDLAEAKKYLLENDVPIKEDPPIPGYKRFSFYDPFDNRIELLEEIL